MTVHEHPDIDTFLDGDLPPNEHAAVAAHLDACEECAAELNLESTIRRELAAMRQPCPEHVLAGAQERLARLERDRPPARVTRARRLAAVFAAAALIAGAGYLELRPSAGPPAHSAEEVAEARRQVELAFGLVGRATSEAGKTVRREVFPHHTTDPLRTDAGTN